jgi:hypothetical protein
MHSLKWLSPIPKDHLFGGSRNAAAGLILLFFQKITNRFGKKGSATRQIATSKANWVASTIKAVKFEFIPS